METTRQRLKEAGCKLKYKNGPNTEETFTIKVSGDWNDGDYVRDEYEKNLEQFLELWPLIKKSWGSEYDLGDLREIAHDEGEDALYEQTGFTLKEFERLDSLCPGGVPDGCEIQTLDIYVFYKDEEGKVYEID